MKSLFRKALLIFSAILTIHYYAAAQGTKEMNDSLFTLVKNLINRQKTDSLYELLNSDFKAKFTNNAFTNIVNSSLYPLGAISESTFLSYDGSISAYKAVCRDAVLEFRLGTDNAGRIAHLRFLPYKDAGAVKNYVVPASNPLRTALDRQIDTIARRYINKANTVGLSIGIQKGGDIAVYGYGETVKRNRKIPDAFSIFEIGSVTKTFTATLLAHYVLENKVSLSDPVTKYLPDSVAGNPALQGITLQMLSNHTSGLPRVPDNLTDVNTDRLNPYKAYNENKLFSYLKNCRLQTGPGVQYAYSNLAAGLLGVILEHISGKTYELMVRDIICSPLGMENTRQHINANQVHTAVYNDKGDVVVMWDMDALAGAGALHSTTHDMLRYLQANMHLDNNPLSKEMQMTHKVTYDKDPRVGLGWHIGDISGTTYYWHNGATGGSRCYAAFIPDKDISVLVLSNSAEDVDDTGKSILKGLQ